MSPVVVSTPAVVFLSKFHTLHSAQAQGSLAFASPSFPVAASSIAAMAFSCWPYWYSAEVETSCDLERLSMQV
jgi:hypothetical protein